MRRANFAEMTKILTLLMLLSLMPGLATSQTAPIEQVSPTGVLLGGAQFGLNQGATNNRSRAPLTRDTQLDLLSRQLRTLRTAEDIIAGPMLMDTFFEVYRSLPPSEARDLYVEVFGRRADDLGLRVLDGYVEQGSFPNGRIQWPFQQSAMTEFESSRFLTALRRDLPAHLIRTSLPNPLPITAICTVTLGQYDFAREVFPLPKAQALQSCFSSQDNYSVSLRGTSGRVQFFIPDIPDAIPVPVNQAEAFRQSTGDYVDLVLPALLSVSVDQDSRTAHELRYEFRATGGFSLQNRQSLEIIWEWPEGDIGPAMPAQGSWVEDGGAVAPAAPLLANKDFGFLLRLASGAELTDRDWYDAMRDRRAIELDEDRRIDQALRNGIKRDWHDTWNRFFPQELRNVDLSAFRSEFEDWSRARLTVLPRALVWRSRGAHGFDGGQGETVFGNQPDPELPAIDPASRNLAFAPGAVLQLPAFLSDYRIDLQNEVGATAATFDGREMVVFTEVTLEINSVQLGQGGSSVNATPREVRLVVRNDFYRSEEMELAVIMLDVEARAFGTVKADLDPAPLRQGPAYWETYDLLRLRHAPETVGENDLQAMLERRFNAEKNDPETPLPHFFELIETLPNDAQSRADFLAWSRQRFPFVEGAITLRLGPDVWTGQFGGAFTKFRSHGNWWSTSWFRGFHPDCRIDSTAPELLQAAKDAAEPQDARRLLACAAIVTGRSMPMSPAHVASYQQADRPTANPPQFVFNLDRALIFSGDLPPNNSGVSGELEVVLRVTGARVAKSADPIPVEIGEAIAAAIMASEPIEARLDQLKPRVLQTPLLQFHASVESATMTSRQASIGTVPLQTVPIEAFPVDEFVSTLAALVQREDEMETPGKMEPLPQRSVDPTADVAQLDILGLSIGMPIDEAQTIVADHMAVGWTLTADRRRQMVGTNQAPPAWSSGRMFVDEANREYISLYFEPDAPEFGLLGVVRWVFVQPQSVDTVRLGPALQQRYGVPFDATPMQTATATGFLWTWTGPSTQANCGYVPPRPQNDIWKMENQDAPFRAPFAIYDFALPDLRTRPNVATYLMRDDIQQGWLCPRTLSVQTSSVIPSFGLPEDQNHAIASILYDEQRAINALRAAEAVRAVAGNAPEGGNAKDDFEVDF